MIGKISISLGALRHNAKVLRELVGPKHAAFVVKSNAYGHGLVETTLAIEPHAALICVYAYEEGLELRDGGITAPILVLGPVPPGALEKSIAGKLQLALWNTGEYARRLANAGRKHHVNVPVHLKVNTGLNRLGFEPHELTDAVEDYLHLSNLEIAGVFSHLASAEEIDSPMTMHQLEVFEKALAPAQPLFERAGIKPVRHIAASAAAMMWPATRLDLSRFGIALYGLWPSQLTREAMSASGLELKPALEYRSEIDVVRTIAAGSPVGYGASFHAPRDMRIGVVPVGYADGVPRLLSNRGEFVVDGARCPIVGRVAMNVTEIDLTNAPNARVGSPVTLIGVDGEASVTADDWAYWAETINYEIVARLPSEIPREYIE